MTIKIEHEAVLYVSKAAAQAPQPRYDDDDAEIVVYSPKEEAPILIPSSSSCDYADDLASLCSTDVSDDDSLFDQQAVPLTGRRVSFADNLITEVRTRPRTPPQDLRALFYTHEETQEFRREYRMERQLLAAQSTPTTEEESQSQSRAALPWQGRRAARHRISRVVIRHHDTLETYDNEELTPKKAKTHSASPFSLPMATAEADAGGDFFDNDSFWSGSITWY